MAKQYWLMKSEEDVYSIDDLEADGSTCWEGVRNYEARNNMQEMKEGDMVLYYHSNAKPSGVVGLARVSREAYPDHYAFDPDSNYHHEKSDPDDPTWYMVDIEYVDTFPERVPLSEVKEVDALQDMELVRRMRLSVQSVKKDEFERIKKMGGL